MTNIAQFIRALKFANVFPLHRAQRRAKLWRFNIEVNGLACFVNGRAVKFRSSTKSRAKAHKFRAGVPRGVHQARIIKMATKQRLILSFTGLRDNSDCDNFGYVFQIFYFLVVHTTHKATCTPYCELVRFFNWI